MFYSELTRLKNVTVNLFQNLAIGVILPNSFLFRTVSSKELLDLHLVRSPARSRRSRTGGEHARERAGAGRPAPRAAGFSSLGEARAASGSEPGTDQQRRIWLGYKHQKYEMYKHMSSKTRDDKHMSSKTWA